VHEPVTKYGWLTTFAEINIYKNKTISTLSLTEDGISFYYKGHLAIIGPLNNENIEGVF